MVNAAGGINGRRITFISYDDAYSPPKTVEQTRRLVEQDNVLFMFQGIGGTPQLAVRQYLNDAGVPQLFAASSIAALADPQHFPLTMGWQPSTETEGRLFAQYVLANVPDARIGLLYQDDDVGKQYLGGFERGLGDRISAIVARIPYELSDPTVDSQMISLRQSGANVLVNFSTPKFASQAIRKAAEFDWHPVHLLTSVAASVGQVLQPAGLDASTGIITMGYLKDVTDPRWRDDPDFQAWSAFMDKWNSAQKKTDIFTVYGYAVAATLVEVLKRCGDDLTRANVMRQATSLSGVTVPMLDPGITIDTSPTDYSPIEQGQMLRFNGASYEPIGPVMRAGGG